MVYWLVQLVRVLRITPEWQWCFSPCQNFWTLRTLHRTFSSTGMFWLAIVLRPPAQGVYEVSFICTTNLETSTRMVRIQNFTPRSFSTGLRKSIWFFCLVLNRNLYADFRTFKLLNSFRRNSHASMALLQTSAIYMVYTLISIIFDCIHEFSFMCNFHFTGFFFLLAILYTFYI